MNMTAVGRGDGQQPLRQRSSYRRNRMRPLLLRAKQICRLFWRTLILPIRIFLAVRRGMTAASVTLLLVGIVSANIIWGYPWIGVFSACFSLFFIGFVLNRWALPSLESDFLLPRSAVAGSSFQARTILTNPSRIPAMELEVRLNKPRQRRRPRATDSIVEFESEVPHGIVPMIQPGQRVELNTSLICQSRGLHRLPDVLVTTWFPFHLFRHTTRVRTSANIAITPRLLSADDDATTGGLLDSLGNWTRKLLSGDAMDYTGSREYEPGMPVRQWDFASWARLGRPIVREFQSPSVRTISLIVDTAVDATGESRGDQTDARLEKVLSTAATAIECICRNPIQLRLFVTGQDQSDERNVGFERETLLIRLAIAQRETTIVADEMIGRWCDHLNQSPVLLLTSRKNPLGSFPVPSSVSILRIDFDVSANPDPIDAVPRETLLQGAVPR